MTNEKEKRRLLEAVYAIGMLFIIMSIVYGTGTLAGLLSAVAFTLLFVFGLLYLKWFKIWHYEELKWEEKKVRK